jgi:hypothetical protein
VPGRGAPALLRALREAPGAAFARYIRAVVHRAGMHMATPQPPAPLVDKIRLVCLDLPEVVEEPAWTGIRWCVRKKNFAHVVMVADGWPPAYAAAAGSAGPLCVLTFRTPRPAAETPRFARAPFFLPRWWPDIAGMTIDDQTDWDAVEALLVASYCALATKKLAAQVAASRS